ncbi:MULTISPECIES: methyltransferase [unclassified Yoonia]|uniref:methyltransferase n=1 Tax=unclassified Yoonia TaxID=2629118 RepID=UPI002B0019C4|nr:MULTISPECIES: methyltransferase [unclassified Yoonia]
MHDNLKDVGGNAGCSASLFAYESKVLSDLIVVIILNFMNKNGTLDKLVYDDFGGSLAEIISPPTFAILKRADIINDDGGVSSHFRSLYAKRRDFLFARIEFILKVTRDVLDFGEDLFTNPIKFMDKSSAFAMFDYSQGFEHGEGAKQKTKKWCDYTASLTDIEAEIILSEMEKIIISHSLSHVLEVGGNIGVFGTRFCERFDVDSYQILDIPVVCCLGEERKKLHDPSSPIQFLPGDMSEASWLNANTQKPDIIIFKSVLHDWPDERLNIIFERAFQNLKRGGQLLIVERASFSDGNIAAPSAADVANLIFAPFYRDPGAYMDILYNLDGNFIIESHFFDMEMRWFILSVRLDQ